MHQHDDDSRLDHNRLEQVTRKISADLDIRWIAADVREQRINVDDVHLRLANEATQHLSKV